MRSLRLRILVALSSAALAGLVIVACGDDDGGGGSPDADAATSDTGARDTGTPPDSSVADGGADAADASDAGDASDASDASDAGPPTGFYAVDTLNRLVRFTAAAPGTVTTTTITGLQGGETIVALDFRSANGKLYGVGSTSHVYLIEPSTGAATVLDSTPFSPALSGTAFGFDVNPVVDRFRLVSDGDQNLRLHPSDGGLTAVDTSLAYAPGDPNTGANPEVSGVAYRLSTVDAGTTALYGVDTALDVLVLQNPPNAGVLNTVGALGIDATKSLGFDIRLEGGSDVAYLVTNPGSAASSSLYTVNLTTGAATLVGQVGGSVIHALAHAP